MKRTLLVVLIVVCFSLPAYAITGLGLGIHGGVSNGYSYESLDDCLAVVAESLGIAGELKFDQELIIVGVHLKVGTLPVIDFDLFADYGFASKDISSQVKLKLHDFSIGATAKKMFGATLFKPYIGAGAALHAMAYEFETDLGTPLPIPDNESILGFHFLGGVELDFPIFPLTPYAEGRYNIITTSGDKTKYFQLSGGLTMNF